MTGCHRRPWVARLRPGSLVSSAITGDIGTVLRRSETGITIRWRVGIDEFVHFSKSDCLRRAHMRRRVTVSRIDPADDETPLHEQQRILREIAELSEQKRREGLPANRPEFALQENDADAELLEVAS